MSPLASNIPLKRHLTGNRGILYEIIQEEPGIHQRELQRRTGIPRGTMSHHLNVLEALGYVDSQQVGIYRRFAQEGTSLEAYGEVAVYAQDAMNQEVMEIVSKQPGIMQKDVLEHLPQYARTTVQHRLSKLTDLGLLRKSHRQGTPAQYWTNDELEILQRGEGHG